MGGSGTADGSAGIMEESDIMVDSGTVAGLGIMYGSCTGSVLLKGVPSALNWGGCREGPGRVPYLGGGCLYTAIGLAT